MTLPERCIDADNLSDAGHVSERKIIVCLADCIKRRGVQIQFVGIVGKPEDKIVRQYVLKSGG